MREVEANAKNVQKEEEKLKATVPKAIEFADKLVEKVKTAKAKENQERIASQTAKAFENAPWRAAAKCDCRSEASCELCANDTKKAEKKTPPKM